MSDSSLLKLRGPLSNRQSLILGITGVIFIFILWAVLAITLSEDKLLEIDIPLSEIKDATYVENDSLLRDDYDLLLAKSDQELADYGLIKSRVYPILPTPVSVIQSFRELHLEDQLVANSIKSIWLNLMGYLVAIAFSIPVGFLLGLIPLVRGLFNRVFDAFRFIPLTAVTGIFVMWLGLGNEMKVAFLAFGIIVYLVPVVVQRISEVDDVYLKTVFTLGATNWQTIRTVYWPAVVSKLSDDIRVLTAISWTYITIAELLNRNGGIGDLIWIARRQSRIDKAFAVLIVIVLIGFLQDRLFLWLDKLLFPYKHVQSKRK